MSPGRTAVVTVAHGRHDHLDRQRASLAASTIPGLDHVVVAMDDPVLARAAWCSASLPSTPLGLPLAAARNRGAEVGAGARCHDPGLPRRRLPRRPRAPRGRTPRRSPTSPTRSGRGRSPTSTRRRPGATTCPRWPGSTRPTRAPGPRSRRARCTARTPTCSGRCRSPAPPRPGRRTGGFCEDYVGYGGEDTDFARVAVDGGTRPRVGAARRAPTTSGTRSPGRRSSTSSTSCATPRCSARAGAPRRCSAGWRPSRSAGSCAATTAVGGTRSADVTHPARSDCCARTKRRTSSATSSTGGCAAPSARGAARVARGPRPTDRSRSASRAARRGRGSGRAAAPARSSAARVRPRAATEEVGAVVAQPAHRGALPQRARSSGGASGETRNGT